MRHWFAKGMLLYNIVFGGYGAQHHEVWRSVGKFIYLVDSYSYVVILTLVSKSVCTLVPEYVLCLGVCEHLNLVKIMKRNAEVGSAD